ncbi:hypothetical protein QR680_014760 [Steinernema hermaphroditum]|uniref:Uncharacterized protein n=1 Tax=Steinernema hermaphroditum TaxID=289476 RepID=A0AA39IA16_9BILA|nr:hypothetical protein QR680_014760 [Steinernema hermaphroditum]
MPPMACLRLLVLLLILLCIVSVSAEHSPIRAKRYEYHVSMPFSSVRIKGTNPLIEGIRTLGRLSDLFQYFRRRY